ncbi:hypothetical protein N2K95_07365 [Arthrobacter zhaoxinii]|uniref:Uncharacterized protein n=1 Tax=Arthrobacter zhaoxinii TaxID=2964616 RepID=A0ABY5YTM9_9MICC|nr:hypothetical protein [Arthrobacter zhaoxinii]UWX98455.1 hypothetical protein N2K95_07365 [Arthrobacter zhaoxinii]
MSKAKEIPGVQPSESLVPRVAAPWLAVVLAIASIVGMIFASETMDDPQVEGDEDWLMLGIVFLLIVFVVSLVVLIKVGVSAKRKLSAANGRIAESLRWQYGFTVDRPKTLILTDQSKPRLNPYDVPATDQYRRPVNIRISPDETGTKVVASICEEHPTPEDNHPHERH